MLDYLSGELPTFLHPKLTATEIESEALPLRFNFAGTVTNQKILEKIEQLSETMYGQGNRHYVDRQIAKIEVLIQLLAPGASTRFDNTGDIYRTLGIPFRVRGGRIWRPNADGSWDADAPPF